MAAATTNKRIKSSTHNNDCRDRISDLPDEIIHKILDRITSPATTAALSKRWRSAWSCYPAVQFPSSCSRRKGKNFKKFVYATVKRFSLHRLMRMETLDISIKGLHSLVNQLLELAAERKPREISLRSECRRGRSIYLPHRLLAGAKVLRWEGNYQLHLPNNNSNFPLFLPSLRCLRLNSINDRVFTRLLAGSPFIETLEIGHINLSKLQISNLPNLKTLKILFNGVNEEVDVEAPGLENLRLCGFFGSVRKMELKAPQVKHLEIDIYQFAVDDINAVISQLPSLKTLTLPRIKEDEKMLKLSIPKLEVFKLRAKWTLEKIELDAGPTLSRFILDFDSPDGLRKCEIDNAIACRYEVNFTMCETRPSYLGLVKSFIDRFPQFQTVSITNLDSHNVIFDLERKNPTAINHLKYCTKNCHERTPPLKALFRVFRPKFLTIMNESRNSETFFQELLQEMSQSFDGKERENSMWFDGLKDVKIVMRYVDRGEEEELMNVSKAGLVTIQKEFCFALTWN